MTATRIGDAAQSARTLGAIQAANARVRAGQTEIATGKGAQRYDEGFAVGYRGHDRSGVDPLLPFGHGLSYGDARWGPPVASSPVVEPGGGVSVTISVTASGDRDATVVVQGYVSPVDPPVEREPKALRTWAKSVVPTAKIVL